MSVSPCLLRGGRASSGISGIQLRLMSRRTFVDVGAEVDALRVGEDIDAGVHSPVRAGRAWAVVSAAAVVRRVPGRPAGWRHRRGSDWELPKSGRVGGCGLRGLDQGLLGRRRCRRGWERLLCLQQERGLRCGGCGVGCAVRRCGLELRPCAWPATARSVFLSSRPCGLLGVVLVADHVRGLWRELFDRSFGVSRKVSCLSRSLRTSTGLMRRG